MHTTKLPKSGWVILSLSTSILVDKLNYVSLRVPEDMPVQHLLDQCPSAMEGCYYRNVAQVLQDGWEPMSVGPDIGTPACYGPLYSFKKLVAYNPGLYLPHLEESV